jgi:hypothetical protein
LVKEYDLYNKEIIEIGCGQGEFLAMLCELGNNRGVGFDPAYVGGDGEAQTRDGLIFIPDFYSEAYANYSADLVVCKMTLEHIPNTADFVSTVRRSLGDRKDTTVFFQVPDVTRILDEVAFWDIYYEHCSYFSMGSLARLFRRCGFAVENLAREYGDQYLMIEARPSDGGEAVQHPGEDDLDALVQAVDSFSARFSHQRAMWSEKLDEFGRAGHRVALWGGGSKAVAFLTTLGIEEEIPYAVDINPKKHGTYLAGTGQEVVAPAFLKEYQPDTVIVMNPVYREEIWQDLKRMGLEPELINI